MARAIYKIDKGSNGHLPEEYGALDVKKDPIHLKYLNGAVAAIFGSRVNIGNRKRGYRVG
jgi:hypothetical protein